MNRFFLTFLLLLSISTLSLCSCLAQSNTNHTQQMETNNSKKLVILWTSQDKEVAMNMVFMYAHYAKKMNWWDEVDLIIWGPSSKLMATDKDLQDYLSKMQEVGVTIYACRACADQYKVSSKLEKLNIDVKYMGEPLTNYLQHNYKVLTF